MTFLIILITLIPILYTGKLLHAERKEDKYYELDDLFYEHIALFTVDIVAIAAFGVAFLASFYFAESVVKGNLVDEKIAVVEEQNAEIENKVKVVVENYLVHESSTYETLKPDDVMVAATMYPALQSNQVVQEQLEVYEENNKKIVSLREEKIDAKIARWWLYFGN